MIFEKMTLELDKHEIEIICLSIKRYLEGYDSRHGGRLDQFCDMRDLKTKKELLDTIKHCKDLSAGIALMSRLENVPVNSMDDHYLIEEYIKQLNDAYLCTEEDANKDKFVIVPVE
jgi:hypothetical protein